MPEYPTFDCPSCNAALVWKIWHAGKTKPCPGCKAEIFVTSPTFEETARILEAVEMPHPLPGETLRHYADLYRQIIRTVKAVVSSCKRCGHPTAAAPVVENAERALRSIGHFTLHVLQKRAEEDNRTAPEVTDAFSSFIAGSDIGGIGISDYLQDRNDRWEDTVTPKPVERPSSKLLDAIENAIKALKELDLSTL